MLYPFVMLIGMLISLMIALNGLLGKTFSAFEVSFIVHFIGLILLIFMMILKGQKVKLFNIPPWFYLSGVLGAMLTAIDAYGALSVGITLYVTISTTSQIISSAVFDGIGVGHLKKIPFNKMRIKSIGLLLLGVGVMLFAQWKGL